MSAGPTTLASVDEAVWALRPDAAIVVLVADGLRNGPSDAGGDALLRAAEAEARADPDRHAGHVAAWRETYRAFGVKPSQARSSVEALLRRACSDAGLPRVNRLVDVYNAVSVRHGLPVGGEDADRLVGRPRLSVAVGDEPFVTVAAGATTVEHPTPGEVVWLDGAGVTCRRWNWRQGVRTRLEVGTTRALFVLERLHPLPVAALEAAADTLCEHLVAAGAAGGTIRRDRLGPPGATTP